MFLIEGTSWEFFSKIIWLWGTKLLREQEYARIGANFSFIKSYTGRISTKVSITVVSKLNSHLKGLFDKLNRVFHSRKLFR